MQLVDARLHRCLKYVVAIDDAGYLELTPDELEAFASDNSHEDVLGLATSIAAIFKRARPVTTRLREPWLGRCASGSADTAWPSCAPSPRARRSEH
jgi:hypothetical protein